VPYLTGIILAISTAALGKFAGFDRDRVFYPTVLRSVRSRSRSDRDESRRAGVLAAFCMSYDVVLAAIVVWIVVRRKSGAIRFRASRVST
jgi:hypothetical protein